MTRFWGYSVASLHNIEAEVLGDISNGFRLKVSVLDIGLYMFGWTVRHSERSKGGWWVQPPATRTATGWKHTVEFDKSNSLWVEIETACINAVSTNHQPDVVAEVSDEDLTDEAISKSLDKAVAELDPEEQPKAIPWLEDEN